MKISLLAQIIDLSMVNKFTDIPFGISVIISLRTSTTTTIMCTTFILVATSSDTMWIGFSVDNIDTQKLSL